MSDAEKLEYIKGQLPLDVVVAFQGWQRSNPDEDYQYDEIRDFVAQLSRAELLGFFNPSRKSLKRLSNYGRF